MTKRWPMLAALVFAALFVAGQLVVPAAPGLHASGAELVRYYAAHGDGIRLAAWLTTLAGAPFVLLVAWLRARVNGIGRDVLLLGAAGIASQTVIWTWLPAGLALHADSLDPNVARAIADVAAYYGPLLTLSVILLAAPVGLAAWQRTPPRFPRWLAWLTAVLVVEQAIETVTVFGKSGFIAPGGAMNFVLGAPLFVVWVIAAAATRPDERSAP